jgi:hypothetical protein
MKKTYHSNRMKNNKKQLHSKILEGSVQSYNAMVSEFVKEIVCSYFGIDSDSLNYNTRKREVVKCKQISMYLIHKNLNMSLSKIGRHFQKNHATVIHSVKTIKNYLEWDKDLKKEIDELEKLVIFKANAMISNYSIENNFYFIDLDNFSSIKVNKKQSLILVGYSDEEVDEFCKLNLIDNNSKKHTKKGMYILEKNQNEENED